MDHLTRRLANYAANARPESLPAAVRQAATLRLVDSLACAIAAYDCEPAAIARRIAQGQVPEGLAGRILGFDELRGPEIAAFANTCMIRNLDWNDQYPSGHPSDCLGALLALGETVGAGGSELLNSMAVAYEIYIRLNDSTRLRQQGWDQGYIVGIATAAACGNLLGLSEDAIGEAIAITAVANVPMRNTRAGRLSLWKGAATAYAVRNGVFGALLAGEGMTGPERPFEGVDGLWQLLTGPFDIVALPSEGGTYRLGDVNMKYWPVEYNGQLAVWAGRQLREQHDWREWERIRVYTYKFAISEIAGDAEKWDPKTRETADHSLPYILARTLVDGSMTAESFTESAYLDESLRPLMNRIGVEPDEQAEAIYPQTVSMRVEAETGDGKRVSLDLRDPLGHAQSPMQEVHVREKFMLAATPVLGATGAEEALEIWMDVGQKDSLGPALDAISLRAKRP
jgi:2-methylcitrate dehydratase